MNALRQIQPVSARRAAWSGFPSLQTSRGGVLILWALGVSATLLLIVLGSLPFFQTVLNSTARSYRTDQALALAEAGVNETLWELNHAPSTWDASRGWSSVCDGGAADCRQKTGSLPLGDGSGAVLGDYTIQVLNVSTVTPTVVVTGFSPSQATPWATETLRVEVGIPASKTFAYALFSNKILLKEASTTGVVLIDSYDSTLGSYGPLNKDSNGVVGANTVLTMWPDVTIKGIGMITPSTNLILKPGATPPTGGWVTQPPLEFPPIVVPAALAATPINTGITGGRLINNADGTKTLVIGGSAIAAENNAVCTSASPQAHYSKIFIYGTGAARGTLNLQAGCQVSIDAASATALSLSQEGALRVNGSNQIFLEHGSFQSFGTRGLINLNAIRKPEDLQIYATGYVDPVTQDEAPAKIAQVLPFYGVVYVQNTPILFGPNASNPNATAYGAFVGGGTQKITIISSIDGENVGIHYDESLRTLALNGSGRLSTYEVLSWQTE